MASEASEMIADIVAEMRSYAKRCREENFGVPPAIERHYHEDDVEYLADRIEAAHKREVEDAERRGNHAATEAICDTLDKVGPLYDAEAVGNAAKLREVLELFAHMNDDGFYDKSPVVRSIVNKARAALAAPPRNCDRYLTQPELSRAYEKYRRNIMKNYGNGLTGEVPTVKQKPMTYDEWLVAPATEKEGGAK